MVGDLVRSEILVGKTRAEVIALLGTPDRDSGTLEYDFVSGGFFGFNDWRRCIQVRFDNENDRVRAVEFFD